MHWYKRNIGDYAKKAGRLTMLQHGSYTLLIDACYDRERFPTLEQAIEWTWASTSEEVEALKFVLAKFFTLGADGVYTQDRILEELIDYHGKSDKNKQIAIDRETKRRENSTNRAQVVHEPPPNQEPRTKNQEPRTKKNTERTARATRLPDDFSPDFDFAVSMGIQNTLEEAHKFRDYWRAQPGQKGVKLDWPATWRNWCRNAKPALGKSSETAYQRSMREKWETLTGRNPKIGEVENVTTIALG
jgi:uncharacterized protein YdaU (DUF1376 family)